MSQSLSAFDKVYRRKWTFVVLFTLVYFLSYSALTLAGLSPDGRTSFGTIGPPDEESVIVEDGEGELPVRVEIPATGLPANVSNPNTTSVAALDQALLSGAVRYPGSGVPGEEGNVLMFGHSSYLPVVQNRSYKAFNDI